MLNPYESPSLESNDLFSPGKPLYRIFGEVAWGIFRVVMIWIGGLLVTLQLVSWLFGAKVESYWQSLGQTVWVAFVIAAQLGLTLGLIAVVVIGSLRLIQLDLEPAPLATDSATEALPLAEEIESLQSTD